MKIYRSRVLAVVVFVLLARQISHADVTVTAVGTPTFDLVDWHLYAAPTDGSFQALYPNHFPRVVHSGFEHELSDGLALTGYAANDVYSTSDFTDPNAVHLGYALVPKSDAPAGSTQDYASGPTIPNGILPITAAGDAYVNGTLFEAGPGAFGTPLPPIDGFDGRSHFVVDHWDNNTFARPDLESLVGDYEYRIAVRDVNNNGYDISAKFAVVPEPTTLAPLGLVIASLAGWVRRSPR
ncbi:MAG: PEP-CTERM sorting domain-containing protein [Planctomycetales bacterium]|nr:PEP-CTERM sorting domain-containing protein [Planctomycetales bacterium]